MTDDAVPAAGLSGTALPPIRTPRLVIRPLGDDDRDASRAVLDPDDEAAFRRWFTWAVAAPPALAELLQPPFGERAVILAESDELIGLVGLVPSLGPFAQLEGAPAGGPWTPRSCTPAEVGPSSRSTNRLSDEESCAAPAATSTASTA